MEVSKIIYNKLDCLIIANHEYKIIVSISVGPRILSFTKFDGDNILCDKGQFSQIVDGENWDIVGGHRLWHSPESFPRTYFSDMKPVDYIIENDYVLFSTPADKSGIGKHIKISFENNKVRISHKLINCGLWPVKLAVWPITILAPDGVAKITLSEEKTGYLPNRNIVFWDYSNINDSRISFKDNSLMIKQLPNSESLKIGTNSTIGIGEYHVNGQIFVKEFEPIHDSEYPDMGCNVEIYTCDYMLEMETLSPLKTLSTGESITHDEVWSIK